MLSSGTGDADLAPAAAAASRALSLAWLWGVESVGGLWGVDVAEGLLPARELAGVPASACIGATELSPSIPEYQRMFMLFSLHHCMSDSIYSLYAGSWMHVLLFRLKQRTWVPLLDVSCTAEFSPTAAESGLIVVVQKYCQPL